MDLSKCKVGDKVRNRDGKIGVVVKIDTKCEARWPLHIRFEDTFGIWYTFGMWYTNDGIAAGLEEKSGYTIVEVIPNTRCIEFLDELSTGDHVSCKIKGDVIDDGIIHREGSKLWICQDVCAGSIAPKKHGKKYSWAISTTNPTRDLKHYAQVYGVENIRITNKATTPVEDTPQKQDESIPEPTECYTYRNSVYTADGVNGQDIKKLKKKMEALKHKVEVWDSLFNNPDMKGE